MTQLPASIEQYLQESGFSATELLVLKRLLEGEALTLRELAAKTGKSTGVLDQATKKLIDKKIVSKESINGTGKYAIASLEAIQRWVEKDMINQHTALKRKKENFDAFLATVQHQKDRPDIECFEGEAGMKKAFEKLLQLDATEWIHFAPAIMREADDPLAQFRVEMFRERRKRKIFMRAITPDSSIGHRYQNRDVYEYRQTRFVSAEEFPVTFEQYIVGDTVACIDTVENKASFIRFPQLAESQKKLFEVMWRGARKDAAQVDDCVAEEVDAKRIPLKTVLASALRECFLSKSALIVMASFTAVALLITAGLYQYTLEIMKGEIGQRLMSIAATAAPEIDARDLDKIHTAEDMQKPEYQRLYEKLNEIRDQNSDLNLQYAYIMRPSEYEGMFEFVADADSNYFLFDLNNPDAPEILPPGTQYAISQLAQAKEGEELLLSVPLADKEVTSDKWGTYLSASAPIFDTDSNGVAIIGIDMDIGEFYKRVNNRFKPLFWFFITFFIGLGSRILFVFCQAIK